MSRDLLSVWRVGRGMLIRLKTSRILFLLAVFALPAFAIIPQEDGENIDAEAPLMEWYKVTSRAE